MGATVTTFDSLYAALEPTAEERAELARRIHREVILLAYEGLGAPTTMGMREANMRAHADRHPCLRREP